MELKTKKIIYLINVLLLSTVLFVILSILTFFEILKENKDHRYSKKIVTTTTMLGDLSKNLIQGVRLNGNLNDYFEVKTLMTTGVDPHNYQAKSSDLRHILSTDLMVTNGLHLEAQMQKAFETLCQVDKKNHSCLFFSAGEHLLLKNENDIIKGNKSGYADPHIWFDVDLWREVCKELKEYIKKIIEPQYKREIESQIEENFNKYDLKLEYLKKNIIKKIKETNFDLNEVYIITSHDAFSYLCSFLNKIQKKDKKTFILEPIQGISTQDEASVSRILELINLIKKKNVKAIFTESSVPENTIKSLKENAVDWVKIVSPIQDNKENILYSDSLNEDNDYIKTFEHNIDIILKYLKKK
ncbi:metal ABC transporter solute-binding protein, Zn/Mn family [Candidatus Phytoplasma prunorum]|uniref:metal ABC transporter solute-binding protein, Zn/Mn family n=1 Tax=Candidatus Phytoplasma prunorum TaxID=47565 RepID=UPI002FF0FA2D